MDFSGGFGVLGMLDWRLVGFDSEIGFDAAKIGVRDKLGVPNIILSELVKLFSNLNIPAASTVLLSLSRLESLIAHIYCFDLWCSWFRYYLYQSQYY